MANKACEFIPNVEYRPHHEPSAGVEICELESIYRRSPTLGFDPYAPHRVQFHHLIYISEGDGTHLIDFQRHRYQAGSFILVNKNQVQALDGETRPRGLMILFTQDFLDSIHASMRLPAAAFGYHLVTNSPVLTVGGALRTSCENLLSEISQVTGRESHDRLVIQLLLAALFIKLRQREPALDGTQPNQEQRKQLLSFVSLVEQHFHTTKDASAYAHMMAVSYKTLNEICKQSARKTPKQLIDAYTILEAKRRLAIEGTQISQLAYELGFKEVTNFVKYFKKHTSETPSQFRDQLAR